MVQNLQFDTVNDRLPPQNIEAEEAILGGILLDPEAIGRVMEILTPDAFYIGAHKDIYRAALDLHAKGQPTDLMTVTVWLKDHDKLDKVGGQSRIAQLIDRTVSAANIDQYATLVMDKYTRRMLIQTGGEISQLGYDTTIPLENVLDQSEQKLFGITQVRPQGGLTATSDILIDTFAEIEQRSLGMVLPGVPCGFYDLDAITQGFQRSDLIITAGRPAMGKCLSADAQVLLADGRLATMAEIYQAQAAHLLTLGPDWRFYTTQPSVFVDDGLKPVFRVRTRSGRELETTLTHPYLTPSGWQPLAELRVGQPVAVPRVLPVFGDRTWPLHHLTVLAYHLGQPLEHPSPPSFSSPSLQADYAAAVAKFDHPAAVDDWIQNLNLGSHPSHTLPAEIFQLSRSQLVYFLQRFLAIQARTQFFESDWIQIHCVFENITLARQIQHLLLRFGIVSNLEINRQNGSENGLESKSCGLMLGDRHSIEQFWQCIGLLGQSRPKVGHPIRSQESDTFQLQPVLPPARFHSDGTIIIGTQPDGTTLDATGYGTATAVATRPHLYSSDRDFKCSKVVEHLKFHHPAIGDICWDEIVAIEPQGLKQVYDLTIPHTHNFVANDICVHNTSFVLNIARNIAALQKLPVAIYSLEMSKLQLVYRLLSSEVEMESSRLRTGRIAQTEWEKLGHAISILSQMPIFIDDTPNISVTEMRSKCRRLQAEQGGALGLILIDYLQLMEGGSDNRVQELSKITRSLKGLARELNVPIIALSQLSRGVESRTNKRPMMSDLRECVTGDTRVWLADGRRLPIADLVGQTPEVISMDTQGRLVAATTDLIWEVGKKPIYELTTASGKKIRATGKHRLYTLGGWQQVNELQAGTRLAVANHMPQFRPSNSRWPELSLILLAHLIGDGSYLPHQPLRYTTASEENSAIVTQAAASFGCKVSRHAGRGMRGTSYGGSAHFKFAPTRSLLQEDAEILDSSRLWEIATSHLYWDEIISIQPAGEETVYDLTVPGTASWLADGIVSHNSGSIEQDADLIMMLYREEYYEPDTPDRGIAEVIVTKHRNGPTGTVKLLFEPQFTRFRNLANPGG